MLGTLGQNDYYSSQAWADASATNDALQAAYQGARDAEASGDPARIAAADQAVTAALQAYEKVTSQGYVTPTGTSTGETMAIIYRLALKAPNGTWGTGATYPGCSSAHGTEVYRSGSACDPQTFQTYDQVVAYAKSRGETVRIVSSEAEAWSIADAEERKRGVSVPVTSTGLPVGAGETTLFGMSMGTVALLAVGAYFLLKK